MTHFSISLDGQPEAFVSSDLLAGLLGTLLGGLISLATAWYFYDRGQRDQRFALAISTLTKMHRLADDVHNACDMIKAAVSEAPDIPTWASLRPIVGFGRSGVTFDADEVALFSRTNQIVFVQELYEASSFHQLLLDVMAEYSIRRDALSLKMAELSIDTKADGDRRESTMPPGARKILEPMIAQVAALAKKLVDMSESANRVSDTASRLSGQLRHALRDSRFNMDLAFGKPEQTK